MAAVGEAWAAAASGGPGADPLASIEPFRMAWEHLPAAVVIGIGPEHRLAFQNEVARALFGPRPLGVPMIEAFPETAPVRLAELDTVFRTGEVVRSGRDRLRSHPGRTPVHASYVVAPLLGVTGVAGVVVTSIDHSGQVHAELSASRAALLAELAERVSGAADAAGALTALTDVLVPRLADVATVYVFPDSAAWPVPGGGDPGGAVARTVSAELAGLGPVPPTPPLHLDREPWPELAAGHTVLLPRPDQPGASLAPDPATREWLGNARARNVAMIPLVAAGTLSGALTLLVTGDRDPYTEDDIPFLTDVAARGATAVAQVRAHRRNAQVSYELQHALLPAAPPRVPGLEIAARYRAGAPDVDVGGDWWDVVRPDPGRLALGVGDVSGRGVPAAVVMGHARAAMRAANLAGLGPAAVLDLLDVQLADVLASRGGPWTDGPVFATAVQVVLDLVTGRATIANAGHPPPLLHLPGAGVTRWTAPRRPPLGLGALTAAEHSIDLPPGASLLLYTDGLVEHRERDIDRGIDDLALALAGTADLAVEPALDALIAAMTDGRPGTGTPDDVVAVLLRVRPVSGSGPGSAAARTGG